MEKLGENKTFYTVLILSSVVALAIGCIDKNKQEDKNNISATEKTSASGKPDTNSLEDLPPPPEIGELPTPPSPPMPQKSKESPQISTSSKKEK